MLGIKVSYQRISSEQIKKNLGLVIDRYILEYLLVLPMRSFGLGDS